MIDSAPSSRSQFAFPRGFRGWMVGQFLAVANAWMDEYAVRLLEPIPGSRILEIGFGPGVAVHAICREVPGARVGGVDPSEVMVRQAVRRNRSAVRRGQVDLRLGSASTLPWDDASFDAVLSLNNAHLWDPVDVALSECRRVLRPGGRIVIGFHVSNARRTAGGRLSSLDDAERFFAKQLASSGFATANPLRRWFLVGTASFLVATRS